jgi:hypothetical protein
VDNYLADSEANVVSKGSVDRKSAPEITTLWNFSERYWQPIVIEDRRPIGGGIVAQGGTNVQMQEATELYVNGYLEHCA